MSWGIVTITPPLDSERSGRTAPGASGRRGPLAALVAVVGLVVGLVVLPAGLASAQDEPTTTTSAPPLTVTTPTTASTTTSSSTPASTSPTTSASTTSTDPDDTSSTSSSTTTTEPEEESTTSTTDNPNKVTPIDPDKLTEEVRENLGATDQYDEEDIKLLDRYIANKLKIGALKQETARATAQVTKTRQERWAQVDKVRDSQEKLDELHADLADAQTKLDAQNARLQITAVESYIAGGVGGGSAGAFLKAETVDDLTRGRVYVGAVVEDEQDLIDEATELRNWVGALKVSAQEREADLRNARDAVEAREAEADRQLEQSKAALAAQQEAIKEDEAIIQELIARKGDWHQRMVKLEAGSGSIEQMLLNFGRGEGPPGLTEAYEDSLIGTMQNPVPRARLSQGFGPRIHPLFGTTQGHKGIDMAIASGEPIVAAEGGIVLRAADVGDGYGNCVIIGHTGGLGTLYGHQSRIVVDEGEYVEKGQLIGYVGSTGYSTGPHLHFEIRVEGTAINPINIINPSP